MFAVPPPPAALLLTARRDDRVFFVLPWGAHTLVGTTDDVIGVVSERDIVRAVAEGLDLDRTTVADIASRRLVWLDADDNIGDAAEEMMEDYVRHVLVRDEGGLVGVLSMRDVLSAYSVTTRGESRLIRPPSLRTRRRRRQRLR